MSSQHNARVALAVCTPMAKVTGPRGDLIYDPISPLWHRARMSLSFGTNINMMEFVADGMEVGDARSRIAAQCLRHRPRPYYLFFLDSDVIVPADAVTKLMYHLKTKPHIDIACGVYVVKGSPPYDPLIYQEDGEGPYWDWAVGDILTTQQHNIRACHMGLTMIRTSLFQRMLEAGVVHGDGTDQEDEPFFCTQNYEMSGPTGVAKFRGTEDIYFCKKARAAGCQLLVDTSVLAGHHDKATGISFGLPWESDPIQRAKWLPLPDGSGLRADQKEAVEETACAACKGTGEINYGNPEYDPPDRPCEKCAGTGKIKSPLKLAIDLGAGGEERRSWPDHRTYTLDVRKSPGVDYVQELPNLNLPDDHYDLVASRHAFEHVGRWEQGRLWAECFRVCKPGGRLEVIVPNIEWAARKIAAGEVDLHVLNVLYGSQEADTDLDRQTNHHLFGYTRDILRALAEEAGFVDVVITDWHDDPAAAYHMTCTARKPEAAPARDVLAGGVWAPPAEVLAEAPTKAAAEVEVTRVRCPMCEERHPGNGGTIANCAACGGEGRLDTAKVLREAVLAGNAYEAVTNGD